MSWIHRIGRYANYKPINYVAKHKDLCHKTLNKEINKIINHPRTIPNVINGKEIYGNTTGLIEHCSPSYKKPIIYRYSYLENEHYRELTYNRNLKKLWSSLEVEKRFAIFEKIASLVEGKYYYKMMAATMVGQGKNILEAELDAIAETVDFLRFNIHYASQIHQKQPIGETNYSQYLPLLGHVAAITPFNFTAIAANLSTAPLYFGNTVFWKPSEKSLLSNYLFYEICLEAGVPPEILHFVIMRPEDYIHNVVRNKCGGVLFTGSTDAFSSILENINYKEHFPRIIGETGGKNFHFVEETANMDLVVEKTYQSAYGYSGQKCSACSLVYVPDNKYHEFVDKIRRYHHINHPHEKQNYCLIGKESYERTVSTIKYANNSSNLRLLMGGTHSEKNGYYVEPTLYKVSLCDPLMNKELFAPILIVKTYPQVFTYSTLLECADMNDYKLTGSVFSRNDNFINHASVVFEEACGNLYINDKSTGSVVGQQPFGGFGKSGTNDKAGDSNFMMRLFNQRNIKVGTI